MRIQLTNRPYWIEQCQKQIDAILKERERIDREYEQEWRKRMFLFWKWPRKETDFPPKGDFWNHPLYPSTYAWRDLYRLKQVLAGLNTSGTNDIFIDEEELRAIQS